MVPMSAFLLAGTDPAVYTREILAFPNVVLLYTEPHRPPTVVPECMVDVE